MPIWVVKATWIEDDADASEQWEVNAPSAHDAVREVSTYIRFQPHHVEVRHRTPQTGGHAGEAELPPGHARRISLTEAEPAVPSADGTSPSQ